MPKVGRRNELSDVEYLYGPKEMTTRNAPFGTDDTPLVRARVIGGQTVYVNDNEYTPRLPRDPSKSPERSSVGATSSSPILPPIPRDIPSPNGYHSALKDNSNSHLHGNDPPPDSSRGLNRHKIIPPISAPTNYNGQNEESSGGDLGAIQKLLHKYTTRESYLPKRGVVLDQHEELLLRNKVHDELVSFDVKKLRDVYLELTGFDRNLSGYVTFQDLSFTLVKAKVTVATDTLRLISCFFVSELEPGKVNYEKVLSFLASSRQKSSKVQRSSKPVAERKPTHKSDHNWAIPDDPVSSPDPALLQDDWEVTSIFSDDGAASLTSPPSSPKFNKGAGAQVQENAKLIRMMQMQLAGAANDFDVESIYKAFREADREHRGTLSKEQIKMISYKCRIPLQESLVNQIIDRFKDINGQYQWERYVMLLERVLPSRTGLPMPDSKRPLEYAKQYPQPSANWPKSPNTQRSPQRMAVSHEGIKNNPQPPWAQSGERPAPPPSPTYKKPQRVKQCVDLPYISPRSEKLSELQKKVEAQSKVDKLERELEKLQKEYESTKRQMEEKKADEIMPWFDRFMKLANALYSNDAANSGYLAVKEVQWLSDQYNHSYSLKIPDKEISKSIQKSSHQNMVALDKYLKMLSTQGP